MLARKSDSSHHVYLLDTLNNVLGILILVLILTQVVGVANSGQAVVQVGEIDQLRATAKELQARIDLQSNQITEGVAAGIERSNADLADLISRKNKELKILQETESKHQDEWTKLVARLKAADQQVKNVPSQADLEEMLARANKLRDDAKNQLQASLEELKSLNEAAAQGGQALNIAQGRPPMVRLNLTVITFVCRNGKLGYQDMRSVQNSFTEAEQRWNADPNWPSGSASLVRYVNTKDFGDESFKLTLDVADGGNVWVVLLPRYGAKWADSKNLEDEEARLKKKLASFDPHTTALEFEVWSDSFENYVQVVTMAKQLGFKTTWEPYPNDEEIRIPVRSGGGPPSQSTGVLVDPQ